MVFMTEKNIARLRQNTLEIAAELAALADWTREQFEIVEIAASREPWFSVHDTRSYLIDLLDEEYDRRGGYPGEEADA